MKKIIILVLFGSLSLPLCVNATGMPVFDLAAVMQATEEVAQLKNQIALMQNQYQQLQSTYNSTIGNRGMGNQFNNPSFANALPTQWEGVYNNGTPIAQNAQQILQDESAATANMSVQDTENYIEQRQQNTAAANKAMGQMAYTGMMSRLNNIESLLTTINQTHDPKDIAELQARIGSEQAIVQNEQTKLTLMQNLQQAEQKLIEQQKDNLNQRILEPANGGVEPNLPTD